MKPIIVILFVLIPVFSTIAQEADTTIVTKTKLSGQWRTFWLSTSNKDELKNFYTLGTGGKLGVTHQFNKKLKLAVHVYGSFNTNLQDLSVGDPVTQKISRYEAGLYDVTAIDDRLIGFAGELFLQYQSGSHMLKLGRMKINSPFINPQDGRMIPTLEQGIWYAYNPKKMLSFQLGFINQIAPRSTGGFYTIGESIGAYPVGRTLEGKPGQYFENTQSDFIFLSNVEAKPIENLKIIVWNYYVDNVFNTLYIKPVIKLNSQHQLAFEWVHQDRIGNGGNSNDSLRYFSSTRSDVFGAGYQFKTGKTTVSIGYDYISKAGQFLFPREWGREFLFSFQKRERSEGSANNHALVLTYDRYFSARQNTWRTIFSVGRHWKPSVTNPVWNKYAMGDYTHFNLDVFLKNKRWKGLEPELLLTYKLNNDDLGEQANWYLNKVDMFQVNAIINYSF